MDAATLLLGLAIFALTTILGLGLFVVVVLLLPRDYFVREQRGAFDRQGFWARALKIAGKNMLGLLIIALGVMLSLPGIPGQGLLTIAIGAILLDIPGKGRLIGWIAAQRGVVRGLNRLRGLFARPPLDVPMNR